LIKLLIITHPDLVDGFRTTGVDAIGVDNAETATRLLTDLLNKKKEILVALDDGIFSQLDKNLIKRMYYEDFFYLVTIPDGPMHGGEQSRHERIFDMIRHATGVKIKFKGENNGS
jgi:vacuolar-type H+-ATPase subunit F/Vma7